MIQRNIATDARGQEVTDRRRVSITDRGSAKQLVAPFFFAPELDQVLVEASIDRVGIGNRGKAGDGRFGIDAWRRLSKREIRQLHMLPHPADMDVTFAIKKIGIELNQFGGNR